MATLSSNGKLKSLLRNSFKRKNKTPYQSWEDEDSVLEYDAEQEQSSPMTPDSLDLGLRRIDSPIETLVECFYLGSYDMSGLAIRGRGCIDAPAKAIWDQSQEEDRKPKRKGSWSSKQQHNSFITNSLVSVSKPLKYVRLVAGCDDLEVHDDLTDEVISQFSFSQISFVGTHPKHSRLFAFIAVARGSQTPLCHAFKCVDKDSADNTAHSLSDVFQHKIQAKQAKKHTIEVSANATVVST